MTFAVPPTRSAAVLKQLREEIVSGTLAPGTAVKDAEVAARFGVSITPVREAVSQLAVEGLISVAPNRTRYVTQVTRQGALELIDVMELLACAGVERGIDLLTEAHLQQLRRVLKAFDDALQRGDATSANAVGAEFSTILISACGNRELQNHVDLVVARTQRVLALGAESELWRVWLDGYRDLLALLEAGDRLGATHRHRAIYRQFRERVEDLLSEPSRGDAGADRRGGDSPPATT